MLKKIKYFFAETEKGRGLVIVSIIILVGMTAFLLGRLSKSHLKPGIEVKYPKMEIGSIGQEASIIKANTVNNAQNTEETIVAEELGKNRKFFASKKGKKYYPAGCSAGKSLKLENRIYFSTSAEAEGAGYDLSSSCQ